MKASTLTVGSLYLIKGSLLGWELLDVDSGGAAHKMQSWAQESLNGEYTMILPKHRVTRYVRSAEILQPFLIGERNKLLARKQELERRIDDMRDERSNRSYLGIDDLCLGIGRAIVDGATLKSQQDAINQVRDYRHEVERRERANQEWYDLFSELYSINESLYPDDR